MAQPDISEALAFFKKTAALDGKPGTSVFDHLTQVLTKILTDKPDNAIELLETTYLAKQTAFEYKDSSPIVPVTAAPDAAKTVAAANLFGNPDMPIDPETGEPQEPEPANEYQCEDFAAHAIMFEALGVGLSKEEMYGVMLAVKSLGEDSKRNVDTVRFFGKFLGLQADYYVFETTLKEPPEYPPAKEGEVPMEENAGANAYVYFVCNYLGGPMTQLPLVTPTMIKQARNLKKFLTGKLTSNVSAFPVFEGTEAHYLRSQIARIASTTICCPKGYFAEPEEDEENPTLEKNEEYVPVKNPRDMGLPANWCHRYQHIKMQGRCQVFKRELPDDIEDEEAFYTAEEKEKGPPPLAVLENDQHVNGASAWTSLYSSSNESVKNQVAGVRSNLWPGAVCASDGPNFAAVYVGWGTKNVPLAPCPPPALAPGYDQSLTECNDLPPKPKPPAEDDEEEED